MDVFPQTFRWFQKILNACVKKFILQGDLKGTIQQDSIDLQRLLSKERGLALEMFSSITAMPCFA